MICCSHPIHLAFLAILLYNTTESWLRIPCSHSQSSVDVHVPQLIIRGLAATTRKWQLAPCSRRCTSSIAYPKPMEMRDMSIPGSYMTSGTTSFSLRREMLKCVGSMEKKVLKCFFVFFFVLWKDWGRIHIRESRCGEWRPAITKKAELSQWNTELPLVK